MSSGIYVWTNKITKNIYIGQAIDLEKRVRDFLNFKTKYAGKLINEEREKYNSLMYWDYQILEECNPEKLDNLEKQYINQYVCAKSLNIAHTPKTKKINKEKKITPKIPHLCQLSYIYKLNKLLNDILKLDNPNKHIYTLKTDLIKIINLIHDERTEIIKHYISEKENYLYDKILLTVNEKVIKEILNSSNGYMLWALFVNFKQDLGLYNKKCIPFIEEELDVSFYIGGTNALEKLQNTFEINETFYFLTKKYYNIYRYNNKVI